MFLYSIHYTSQIYYQPNVQIHELSEPPARTIQMAETNVCGPVRRRSLWRNTANRLRSLSARLFIKPSKPCRRRRRGRCGQRCCRRTNMRYVPDSAGLRMQICTACVVCVCVSVCPKAHHHESLYILTLYAPVHRANNNLNAIRLRLKHISYEWARAWAAGLCARDCELLLYYLPTITRINEYPYQRRPTATESTIKSYVIFRAVGSR